MDVLTGFMFGNVNEEGELEDESLLDKETVSQLSRMGVGDVMGDLMEPEESSGEGLEELVGESSNKSPTAQDFGDITEVAEEEPTPQGDPSKAAAVDSERLYQKGVSFALSQKSAPTALTAKTAAAAQWPTEPDDDYDTVDGMETEEGGGGGGSEPQATDSGYDSLSQRTEGSSLEMEGHSQLEGGQLSQGASLAVEGQSTHGVPLASEGQQLTHGPESKDELTQGVSVGSEGGHSLVDTAERGSDSQTGVVTQETGTKNEVSGPSMPSLIPDDMSIQDLHAKVKALFPGFKPDGILRFSSLLGPGKPSSLPRLWQEARKPRRRRKREEKAGDEDGGGPRGWKLDFDPDYIPPPEMCLDDEEKFLSTGDPSAAKGAKDGSGRGSGRGLLSKKEVDAETREWRFGPAKLWYDMMGVSEDGRGLDYGFKMKQQADSASEASSKPLSLAKDEGDPPDDAFLMVTQQRWEDKVLHDVPYTPTPQMTGAGGVWRPVSEASGLLPIRSNSSEVGVTPSTVGDHTPQSMFPIDNYEVVYSRWEDDIIWDSEAVTSLPRPHLSRIDPNDPNFVLGIPEEPRPSLVRDGKKDPKKSGRYPGGRGNKGGGGDNAQQPGFLGGKKDPFNLSNDEYYNPRHVSSSQGLSGLDSHVVQHSTPALNLHPPWFPTHLSSSGLRNFHRPKLRIRCPRSEDTTGFYTISALTQHISNKEKEREKERVLSGGGEVFFMRTPEDLSVCDGQVVLAECSEQYPPLINNIGMANKVKNYYRRPERQVKSHAPQLKHGETTYVQNTSYFLGQLKPGQTLQSFENNLFRAPAYPHELPPTDFLLTVSGDKVYLRLLQDVFVVGQQCPKVEVPAPGSKPATQFQKELLQVYLYRLFRENDEVPKRIKMEVVRKAFPQSVMSESVIRKILKTCADFKREGYETGWWVLRSDFRLPTEEEIRSMITPEQVCAYHSMLASEYRLKEAGYRGKSLFAVEEEDEESASKVDDEIRAAPWNTTHNFVNASKGRYQLSVSGPADPTGCGEGFSYTRLNPKRDSSGSLPASRRYKSVMGTDGDLRKLKLSKAKSLLRNFGVPEDEISKLSRWQVIDRVREHSTEAAKSGDGGDIMNFKFARGARFSQMEAQERYKEECQRVFNLQNTVLSSAEVLSTDEESSNSGGESDDELGRNLETLLRGKKTSAELSHEQEEVERQELRRLLSEERQGSSDSRDRSGRGSSIVADMDDNSSVKSYSSATGRRLIISRTFCDDEGREFVRDEVVKRQDVISAYIQLSSDVRSKFADQDEQTREDMKKEKRKIQDQLRRWRKIEEKAKKKEVKPKKPKPLTTIKMRCSACGQTGHMKTNRNCPMYKNNPVNVIPTDQELAEHEFSLSQDDLVKVEGTKVVLNRAVVEHAKDLRKKSLLLKIPKDMVRKRRRQAQEEDLDYLETRKSVQRRRTNPEVPFSDQLEKILQILVALPESYHFRKPVQVKVIPDYYNIIKFPMDLQTMRDHCRHHVYKSREAFWEHINLIVTNCITYNGAESDVTKHAHRLLEVCEEEVRKVERELEQLETEINPALDDNALVALSYVLGKAVDIMKSVPETWPFHHPVSAKKIPDYHKIIKYPMDLQTVKKNCSSHRYLSKEEFLVDVNQIVENSITYNGPSSPYTKTAEMMREMGLQALEEDADLIAQLEARLRASQAKGQARSRTLLIDEASVDYSIEGDSSRELVEGEGSDYVELLQDLQHSSDSEDSTLDMED